MTLAELVAKNGVNAKLVRAYCKLHGYRYTAQGAPAEWYAAWPGIAKQLAGMERKP